MGIDIGSLNTGCEYRQAFLSCLNDAHVFSWGVTAREFLFQKWRKYQEIWIARKFKNYGHDPIKHVTGMLLSRKYRKTSSRQGMPELQRELVKKKVVDAVYSNRPIEIVIPAFPFKSPNIAKCARRLPDIAEVGSLGRLWEMSQIVADGYEPGLTFHLLSDGTFLCKVFGICPHSCIAYMERLRSWISMLGFDSCMLTYNLSSLVEKNYPGFWGALKGEKDIIKSISPSEFGELTGNLNLNYSTKKFVSRVIMLYLKGVDLNKVTLEDRSEKIREAACLYLALWEHLRNLNILERLFPTAIKASPTAYHPERNLCLYMLSDKETILPWMGVGTIKLRGSMRAGIISAKYEFEVVENDAFLPIYLKGEETPFGYIERESQYGSR